MQNEKRITLRMPADIQAFLATAAAFNCTSQNAEIIRSVRERMAKNETASESAGTLTEASPGKHRGPHVPG